MSVTLENHLNILDDFRIDTSADTVDPNTEGIRAINHVIRTLDQVHYWEFTTKRVNLNYYKDIYSYAVNSNYRNMIGLYDLINFLDPFTRVYPISFRRMVNRGPASDYVADEFADGVTTLKVYATNTTSKSIVINSNSSYDGNGTWVGTGGATDVATDSNVYIDNSGSVRFTLDGVSNGVLTNSSLSSLDLSTLGPDQVLFAKFVFPSAATSVILRWGNDSGVYHEVTKTTQFDGRAFTSGINQLGWDLLSTSDAGSPADATTDWVQIEIESSNSGVYRLSELTAKSPHPYEFSYYSNDFVYDVSGSAWVSTFGNDNNDYGAWSGRYDWFANVIDLGLTAQVLDEMQEDSRAKKYWSRFIGNDNGAVIEGKIGGALGEAMRVMPSRIKSIAPASFSLDGGGGGFPSGDYYSNDGS